MINDSKVYSSKLVAAYKEGHYGQSLESIINTRTPSQVLADEIRFIIKKYRKNK